VCRTCLADGRGASPRQAAPGLSRRPRRPRPRPGDCPTDGNSQRCRSSRDGLRPLAPQSTALEVARAHRGHELDAGRDYSARRRVVLPIPRRAARVLSLATDLIPRRSAVSVAAAEPTGVPLPGDAVRRRAGFTTYPARCRCPRDPSVYLEVLDSLHGQGFSASSSSTPRRATSPPRSVAAGRAKPTARGSASTIWWTSERVEAAQRRSTEPDPREWFENFPWTRLEAVTMPERTGPSRDDPVRRPRRDAGTLGEARSGAATNARTRRC